MDNIAAVPTPQVELAPKELAPIITTPPVDKEITTAPLSIYEQDHGLPYTAVYFGMKNMDYATLKETDIGAIIPKLEIVNNWITQKVLNEEYPDSTESFDAIIGQIKEQLGIQDNEPPMRQLEKIYLYLNEGKAIASTFHVQRSTKADELDMNRDKMTAQFRANQPQTFRKLDGLFSKFFNP